MISQFFESIFGALAAVVLLWSGPRLTIQVHPVPKSAPDSPSVAVQGFSVRSAHGSAFEFLKSPALVSDPSTWQASRDSGGVSMYGYDHNIVVVELAGKILATFQAKPYGRRDVKITIRTAVASDITCWGGGKAAPSNDHATVQVANKQFVTPGGILQGIGLSFFVISRDSYEQVETGDPLIGGARLPIFWTKIDAKTHELFIGGADADIHVAYSADRTPREYLKFLYGITGKPKLPPIYALGFMASRWGWEDQQYISDVLDEFDLHDIPLDAFIMDFEWYLNFTGGDYLIPSKGLHEYPDFRFGNSRTFPDPSSQAREYRARGVKMGGIRKPRLGDDVLIEQAHAKKWTLTRNLRPSRDLNFALKTVREWYGEQTRNMLELAPGLPDFFWNDEGETSYFTYHHWIEAEQLADPQANVKRRFSLNRAFTPGMQRLESAAVWTGDVETTWASLRQNIDMFVRWTEAGVSLVSFDIGGFVGPQGDGYEEILVRWYQAGVFAGVMRAHSTLQNKAHFPFSELWGPDAASAMRSAVHLRYALIPTIVSSLYELHDHSVPWLERKDFSEMGKPARDFLCANRRLFVAPVLTPMNTTGINSFHSVEFPPEAKWYPLDAGAPLVQGDVLDMLNVGLDVIPVFAREGSIIFLHGTDISQATRAMEMVGGEHTLIVRIFAHGSDASAVFSNTLQEDDGESLELKVRTTTFEFHQESRHLAWVSEGSTDAPHWYHDIHVIYRLASGEELEGYADLHPASGSRSLLLQPGRAKLEVKSA